MAEFVRGVEFKLVVETNKRTREFTGASFDALHRVLSDLEHARGRALLTSARARLAVLRTAAWNAFDNLWREVCDNFGDFEDEYRAWKRGGADEDDLDRCEHAAYVLYAALVADTVAAASEEDLRRLDAHGPIAFGDVALQWFREARGPQGGAS